MKKQKTALDSLKEAEDGRILNIMLQDYYKEQIEKHITLEDMFDYTKNIYPKPGEFILFQTYDAEYNEKTKKVEYTQIYKPVFALIVESFNFDMACAIHYVKLNKKESYFFDKEKKAWQYKTPEVEMLYDWMYSPGIIILGYWYKMPSFKKIMISYRERISFTNNKEFISKNYY